MVTENLQEIISQIFEQVNNQLSELLKLKGFQVFELEINEDAFDSKYVIWKNAVLDEAIRFKWDGKEFWFVLEESPIAEHLKTWKWPWADILLIQIDKSAITNDDANSIIDEFVKELK